MRWLHLTLDAAGPRRSGPKRWTVTSLLSEEEAEGGREGMWQERRKEALLQFLNHTDAVIAQPTAGRWQREAADSHRAW